MKATIIDEINAIEEREAVKILYAVESGSRAWGFPSLDSDYDVRFIYTRPAHWYLTLENRRDVLEYPIDDLLDISGWDLRKTLQLFHNSNPSLIEWLYSPIVYHEVGELTEHLRGLSQKYYSLNTLMHHYLSMARGTYHKFFRHNEVEAKRYFYVIRPILAARYIDAQQDIPPIPFEKLLYANPLDALLIKEIERLLERKKGYNELSIEPRIDIIDRFIENEMERLSSIVDQIPNSPALSYAELDQLFQQYLL